MASVEFVGGGVLQSLFLLLRLMVLLNYVYVT